ncbi:MAG: DUF885 domain-containing protein [Candidatus Limnocylindria bacterium]
MTDFRDLFSAFLDEFGATYPVAATSIGDHRFDGRWPDASKAGHAAALAFTDRWLATFRDLDASTLDATDAIDRDLIVGELEAERFGLAELQDERWDPLVWVYLLGEGLFPLVAREFAPLAARLTSVAERLEGMAALLADAASAIGPTDDGRPVGRLQTETAIAQLPGVNELIDDALAEAKRGAEAGDEMLAGLRPRLEAAATAAKGALAGFTEHLRSTVLPAAEGEGRLGRDLFAAKLRHTMRAEHLTPERLIDEAEAQYVAVRAEMVRLATAGWERWRPGQPMPEDPNELVRSALDAIADQHQPAEALLDYCRAENERIEAFCRQIDLIGLADEPLDIRWTPVFLRAFGGAMLISPGPLDKGLTSFFAITPMPDDWSPERKESYLREDNDRMLRLLTIHEAVPGHYLQGVYANRSGSLPRSVFWSGVFAEGWAVYVTQVMMDVGYGADDPALLLTHWKFYLRAITNAIIDAKIHVEGMSEERVVQLQVQGGFQEEAEARSKYTRARLSSTQLSTYFAGSMEMWDIELEARRRAAAAVGADPDAIQPGPLPGGFGETPGFRYREHLERVIAHGAPPTSLLRRILFG